MKKINLLFMALALTCVFALRAFAQDDVYNDIDRTNWIASAPPYSPTDAAVGGGVAGAEYLLDGDQATFLALVKPGKSLNGVTGPATIEELYFTIEMGAPQTFNYFRLLFRKDNSYDYLRPWAISVYGSNGTGDARTWTLITDMLANEVITLPNAEGNGGTYSTGEVLLNNTTAYSSVKVVYRGMSPSGSGSSLQAGEFFLGSVSYDRVLYKPADVSFGDIMQGASAVKTLTVTGANLISAITYTVGGEDASAFTVTPGAWTSAGGTADITFSPTARKLYNATLTIASANTLESQTINLTGNADFDLPVQLSEGANEHWYYVQFARQATEGKVWTVAESDTIKQLSLVIDNAAQLWKVSGTWDNYVITSKSNKNLYYAYAPAGQDPVSGTEVPEVNSYILQTGGDKFGFVRYQTTDTWQLKNLTSTAPEGKIYLNDISGTSVGGYSLNNAGNQLTFIAADLPQFVVPGDTVPIGSTKQNTSKVLTVPVSGVKLTSSITVSKSEDADDVFTLNTATLPAAGGDVEITYAPTAYKKLSCATITLTSGGATESFVVSATSDIGVSKYYVGGWNDPADGEVVAAIPTTTLKAGDEVWIAAGEYTTGQITVPANVSIYGGFAGTETSPEQRAVGSKPWEFTNATVLKNSASLVLSITGANTVIDGITFEGTSVAGRAIQNTSTAGTGTVFRNNIVKNFTSNADGGGMNIRYETEIYNCLITGNSGNKGGAGYFDRVTIHDCEITNNTVPTTAEKPIGSGNGSGGGIFLAPEGTGCRAYNLYISGNTATFGGGAFVRRGSKLYNSIIVNNTAAKSGSGVAFDERDSIPYVYNVTIADNRSTAAGGAGVCFTADGTNRRQILYNSILYNNTDLYGEVFNIGVNQSGAGEATPEIKNVIIDDLTFYAEEISPKLVITAGIAETVGTILFGANWVTAATSPGKEKGSILLSEAVTDPDTGDEVTPATYLEFATGKDYAGNPRIGGTIDIGPYEDQSNVSIATPSTADGNVIAVKYYTIQGVEVRVPVETGIYIKKEWLDTNKTRVSKILFINK